MPALQVRDFPDELYEELKEVAKKEHRSIAQQTIVAVQEYVRKTEEDLPRVRFVSSPIHRESEAEIAERMERRRQVFERIDALPPFEVPEGFPSPEEIIRELRDSR